MKDARMVAAAAAFVIAAAVPIWSAQTSEVSHAETTTDVHVSTTDSTTDSTGAGQSEQSGTHGDDHAADPEAMDAQMAKRDKSFPAKTAGKGAEVLTPKVLADGTKEFSLTTSVVKWEVEPGKVVDAWTFNGAVPGPTLKVGVGDKVRIVVRNTLPESTSVHWHGILVPNDMDGVANMTQDPIKPGKTFTYEFTAERAAVGWYHSHHDGTKQVGDGMWGTFLIGDMPRPDGVQVTQSATVQLQDSGAVGLTLNGKSFPATQPIQARLGEWVEIHYVNAGQQAHPMHLHGLDQLIIAKDGYPLETPYNADTVFVAPGERYTALVHANRVGSWLWHCHIFSHSEGSQGMFGMVTAMIVT